MRAALCLSVVFVAALAVAGCGALPGAGQPSAPAASTKQVTAEDVANLAGPDRQKLLEEGARREGKLTWYTALIVDQIVQPLVTAFQAKYPYLKVEYYRANTPDLVQRLLQEHRAGQGQADLTDGSDSAPILRENQLIIPFTASEVERYPASLRDKDRFWTALYTTTNSIGYNTRLVAKADVPKTYQDLLQPRWKGKLAWSNTGTFGGPGFVGHMLTSMGEERGMW